MAVIAGQKTASSGTSPKNRLTRAVSLGFHAVFIAYSLLCIIPILLIVSVSLSDEKSVVNNGYRFIPEKFNLAAYEFLWRDIGQIAYSYKISILVTLIGTLLSVMIIALYAYPISRSHFPHAKFFTFFVFFTMLFSGGLVPWYLVYVQMLDLKDTLASLIIPLLMSAFWVLVVRTFFKESVPRGVGIGQNRRSGRTSNLFQNGDSSISAGTRYGRAVPDADLLERLVP